MVPQLRYGNKNLYVVALAGGVGGAKMAHGFAKALERSQIPAENLTVTVNIGDDFEHLGLTICPDLDTVCYTLAGIENPKTGWGRANESWKAMEAVERLGGPTWFRLGDRDVGLHLERTHRLRLGESLSQVTRDFCHLLGISSQVLPVSDDRVPTRVYTSLGELSFQEYFVYYHCAPKVTGFSFEGVENAMPAPGVIEALDTADLVVICPSNPWVSIDPILAVPGILQAVKQKRVVAVSPIIGGQTVKGPAAKMFTELGIQPSPLAVTRHYAGLLQGFILDQADHLLSSQIKELGMDTLVTNTLMNSPEDRVQLAMQVLDFAANLQNH